MSRKILLPNRSERPAATVRPLASRSTTRWAFFAPTTYACLMLPCAFSVAAPAAGTPAPRPIASAPIATAMAVERRGKRDDSDLGGPDRSTPR